VLLEDDVDRAGRLVVLAVAVLLGRGDEVHLDVREVGVQAVVVARRELDGEDVGHDGAARAGDGAVVHGPPDVAGDLDGVHGGAQVLGEGALDGTLEARLEAVEQTHQRTSCVWAQVGSGLARLSAGAGRFLNGAARTVD
jgi:hypothetical protein